MAKQALILSKSYKSGYAKLAAAIILLAQKENDQRFLNSDWCDELAGLCELDALMDQRNIDHVQHMNVTQGVHAK